MTSFGLSCAHHLFPGVYAKITENVKTWINTVANGTQDDCDRDYFLWRKMRQSADFEADDFNSQDEEEDQTNPVEVNNTPNKNIKQNKNAKVRTRKNSKGVQADESVTVNRKQSLNPKRENDSSYVRRLLALLQAQGKI